MKPGSCGSKRFESPPLPDADIAPKLPPWQLPVAVIIRCAPPRCSWSYASLTYLRWRLSAPVLRKCTWSLPVLSHKPLSQDSTVHGYKARTRVDQRLRLIRHRLDHNTDGYDPGCCHRAPCVKSRYRVVANLHPRTLAAHKHWGWRVRQWASGIHGSGGYQTHRGHIQPPKVIGVGAGRRRLNRFMHGDLVTPQSDSV